MKISVAIAVYNGAKYIKEQLDSILNQSYPIHEVIIIDDKSTDNSIDIIQAYNSQNIKLTSHKKNLGLVKTFEEAIKKTTGDIIFLSDQDDIWNENKVEVFVEAFEETNALICFSDADIIGRSESSFMEDLKVTSKEKNLLYQGKADLLFAHRNICSGALLAFRSDIKKMKIFPFIDQEKYMLHDRFICSVVASQFPDKIHFIDEKLSSYRIHKDQYMGFNEHSNEKKIISKTDYFKNELKLREYVIERAESPHFRRSHYFWFVRSQLHQFGFLQRVIRINTMYLEGDYKRFTKNPIKEALADMKL